MKFIDPYVEILSITPEPLKLIEKAGRVCYKSEDKINDDSCIGFVRSLIKKGHESVLEHASATLRLVCDRGVSHELVRHRLASYSQESTRYCNYCNNKFGNELTFIRPLFFKDTDKIVPCYTLWQETMKQIENVYLKLLDMGISPQIARSVLPNSLKTEVIITANFREWRYIFMTRCGIFAHPDMCQIMNMARELLSEKVPVVFDLP